MRRLYRHTCILLLVLLGVLGPGCNRKPLSAHGRLGTATADGAQGSVSMDRGRWLLDKGDWEGAIREFNEALRVNPTNVLALEYRGVAFLAKGDAAEALSDFNQVIALDPANERAYVNRANAYYLQGQWDKVVRDLEECLWLNPTNAYAIGARAAWLVEQGRLEMAVAEFARGIKADPKSPLCYNGLAWVRATCPEETFRDGKEAVKLARKGCELTDWKEPRFVDTLAAAYAEVGDFDQAVRLQKLALGMESSSRSRGLRLRMEERLRLYEQRQPYRDERLRSRPQNP